MKSRPTGLAEIGTKNKDQVHITPLTAWWYAPMNTRLAPFDNVKVRQAVNFAIDRNALVNIFGGPVLAQPVCQVLPPGLPRACGLLPLHQGSRRPSGRLPTWKRPSSSSKNPAPRARR